MFFDAPHIGLAIPETFSPMLLSVNVSVDGLPCNRLRNRLATSALEASEPYCKVSSF
jgi:hypothetical protein